MKTDLDRLMEERGLDALITLPGENEDPYRTYLGNGADFAGLVIKKRGDAARADRERYGARRSRQKRLDRVHL